MGALSSEKDERIAFHCTQLRVAHVRAVVKVDPQGTQVALRVQRETRTRRSASTRRTQEVLFIPDYLRLDDSTVKSETAGYLAFIANGQTARPMQLL